MDVPNSCLILIKLYNMSCNIGQIPGTSRNLPEPPGTSRNLPEPLRNLSEPPQLSDQKDKNLPLRNELFFEFHMSCNIGQIF